MLSIIIPTLNRKDQLEKTLRNLIACGSDMQDFEVIVVDNGSDDGTKDIVHDLIHNYPSFPLNYFYDAIPGLLTGRHRGAKEAKGAVLAFLDDDVLISSTWLDTAKGIFKENKEYVFATGPNLPYYESYPPKWLEYFWLNVGGLGRACGWLSLLDFGDTQKEIPLHYVWGLNYLIKKDAFELLEGFHPDNIPKKLQHFQGDGEIGLTIKGLSHGMKAVYHPGLLLHHQISSERMTKEYFGRRAYYQGVCDSYTHLRKEYRPQEYFIETNVTNNVLKANWKGKLANRFGAVKQIAVLVNGDSRQRKDEQLKALPKEIQELFAYTTEERTKGYEFHQNAFQTNPLVKEWVLRENYWDYNLPE